MSNAPTIERLAKAQVVCTATFTEEERLAAEEAAVRKLGASVSVPGFRAGFAPTEILREKIDPGALFEETVRSMLPTLLTTIVKEHGVQPIIPPRVEITSERPVAVRLTFTEKPEVKLKNAAKITVKKKPATVEEKDVDTMVNYVLRQHQKSTPVERPAAPGDRVTMDFWAEDEGGKEIPGIRSEGHQAILGSNTLIPGFEEQVTGLAKGGTKDFALKFPEKHQVEDLRGKPVTFHVTMVNVEELHTPALTDAFAKEHLGVASAESFRTELRQSMHAREAERERQRAEEEALGKIRDATQVDLAEELVTEEKRSIFEELARELDRQGMGIDEWLKRNGKSPEDVEKDLGEQAQKRLKLRLGLSAIIQERAIAVSDEDMKKAIDTLLSPLSVEERLNIAPAYAKGAEAYEQLKWQKTIEALLDTIITE